MDNEPIPIELGVRVAVMVIWALLLARANYFRVRGLRRQFKARSNGLRLLVTKERVARIIIKDIWWVLMGANILNRILVDDIVLRSQIADVDQMLIIVLCGIGLLASDEYFTDKIVSYDNSHVTKQEPTPDGERKTTSGDREATT